MKKLNNILLLALSVFIVSCSDSLDIQPEQSLSTENAFSDENTARASLSGVYSRAQALEVFGAMPQIIEDYQSDNVTFIGSFPTLQDINNYNTIADNASIATIWQFHFRVVLAANAVIANTQGTDDVGFSDEEKADVIGQAKYLRAITYFNLVRLFAQPYTLDNGASPGVSIITEPYILTGAEVDLNRNTVAQVYDFIEQDLLDAFNALGPATSKFNASKGAAAGMLSRLYLYKGDNASAIQYADEVLNDAAFGLATDLSFYDGNGPEQVFSISNTAVDNGRTGSGGWASYYMAAVDNGRGDCLISQDLQDAYGPVDLRLNGFSKALTLDGIGDVVYTLKFPDAITNTDDAPVQRTSEVVLNKAEALVKTNGLDGDAVDLVNPIRVRAGLAPWSLSDFASGDELLAAILEERRKELAFEGHRRSDLLRNGLPLRAGQANSNPGDDKVVMPIPQREIDLGSNTPQNSGY